MEVVSVSAPVPVGGEVLGGGAQSSVAPPNFQQDHPPSFQAEHTPTFLGELESPSGDSPYGPSHLHGTWYIMQVIGYNK